MKTIFDKDYIKEYTYSEKMKIIKPQEKIESMWGLDNTIITNKDIEELKAGNLLWFSDGEYAHTISYKVGEIERMKEK